MLIKNFSRKFFHLLPSLFCSQLKFNLIRLRALLLLVTSKHDCVSGPICHTNYWSLTLPVKCVSLCLRTFFLPRCPFCLRSVLRRLLSNFVFRLALRPLAAVLLDEHRFSDSCAGSFDSIFHRLFDFYHQLFCIFWNFLRCLVITFEQAL